MGIDLSGYDVAGATHLTTADDDEYEVKIISMKTDEESGDIKMEDSSGQEYMLPKLEVVNHEDADNFKDFTHFMRLPNNDMDAKEIKQCLAKLNDFGLCFEVDFAGKLQEADFVGQTGNVILMTRPDEGYGEQNAIKQCLIPR